jgi:hypothetical protein
MDKVSDFDIGNFNLLDMKEENSAHGFTEGSEEKIFIDGDFNDSYESRVKRATGKNTVISKAELQSLRDQLAEKEKEIAKLKEDEDFGELEEYRSDLAAERKKNEELIATIKSHGDYNQLMDTCNTLQDEVDQHKQVIRKKNQKNEELKEIVGQLVPLLEFYKNKLEELNGIVCADGSQYTIDKAKNLLK